MRRAPGFWQKDAPTLSARLLQLIGHFYGQATARRMAQKGLKLAKPVIAIGNFTAGGAGKTPTALHIGAWLRQRRMRPVFVSRGYGGKEAGPLLVDPQKHDANQVGDEALLLARSAPTVIGRDRAAAGRMAEQFGDVVILDDALQNPALQKDWTLAVIDGPAGIGNGLVIPAGPLRAPLADQLPFVDATLIIGPDRQGLARSVGARPVLNGSIVPDAPTIESLRGYPLHAFAGIGRPEKFFAMLRSSGLSLVRQTSFGDHQPLDDRLMAKLLDESKTASATLVTTTKDIVRLSDTDLGKRLRSVVIPIEIELMSSDLDEVLNNLPFLQIT
jgi:tetraacyldisaccharide 4'-kinase